MKQVKQLDAEGKAPRVVTSSSKSIAPMPEGGVFNLTIRNVSDSRITLFKSVAVLLDAAGKPVPDGEVESGWGELSGIEAGQSVQMGLAVPGDASRITVAFKEAFWKAPNPLGKDMPALTMTWKNKRLEEELAAARAGK